MKFSDDFLKSLADWQRGWNENQAQRVALANKLLKASIDLDSKFKRVGQPCYRKRFLHHGELVDIILKNEKHEDVASWTINQEFAERFKGLEKTDAVSGAIFEHIPDEHEVVVNVCELWKSDDFIRAVNIYKDKWPKDAEPLFHFKDTQGEVILRSPLKGDEIIALTGASSPFDDLCDHADISEAERDDLFAKLVQGGNYPGVLRYTSKESTQRIIENVIKKMHSKILEYKSTVGWDDDRNPNIIPPH